MLPQNIRTITEKLDNAQWEVYRISKELETIEKREFAELLFSASLTIENVMMLLMYEYSHENTESKL